jgi:outer membrane murein-binding lipoprotein Lpp
MQRLDTKIDTFRDELKTDIHALGTRVDRLDTKIDSVRTELKADI